MPFKYHLTWNAMYSQQQASIDQYLSALMDEDIDYNNDEQLEQKLNIMQTLKCLKLFNIIQNLPIKVNQIQNKSKQPEANNLTIDQLLMRIQYGQSELQRVKQWLYLRNELTQIIPGKMIDNLNQHWNQLFQNHPQYASMVNNAYQAWRISCIAYYRKQDDVQNLLWFENLKELKALYTFDHYVYKKSNYNIYTKLIPKYQLHGYHQLKHLVKHIDNSIYQHRLLKLITQAIYQLKIQKHKKPKTVGEQMEQLNQQLDNLNQKLEHLITKYSP